jgi:small conductance mechanosensitive channel
MGELAHMWEEIVASFSLSALVSYSTILLRIILIIAGLIIAGHFGKKLIDGFLKPERIPGTWDERRILTLRGLAWSLLRYSLYIIGGMMVLSELGVNTASLLAGVGIAGLAIGFGAQNLVRDVISRFFILFEDQFAVGDFVTIAGVTGTVEEMGLRVTKVREWDGTLHIIPNGEISKVANHSRGSMGVRVEVDIAYEENVDRAIEVLERICKEAAADHREIIIEEPTVLGVSSLGESGVTIQIFGKVQPMQQWQFARELRRRIKEAFDREGIEIPYPRRVVLWRREGDGSETTNAV